MIGKKLFTLIAVLAILLIGCAKQPIPTDQTGTTEATEGQKPSAPDWNKVIQEKQDEIAAWSYMPDGGLLTLYNMDRFVEEEYGPYEGEPFYSLLQMEIVNGKLKITELFLVGPDEDMTAIFYDEDWETNLMWKSYLSSFRRLKDPSGEESMVLIVVTPNRVIGQSYQESEYYQVEPSDSLNSTPLKVHQEDYMLGDPFWFYVIPIEKITEDYELRYGEFVLTGTDILTNSWSIGDAPVMPYPGYDR